MKIAVYPGSFDPITNGHMDIIERASQTFDKVIVSVLTNSSKTPSFTKDERVDFINRVTSHLPNVFADSFSGLLVEYLKKQNASIIIKGLRAVSDFEYEFQMALANRIQAPNIETLFLMTSSEYMFLSSSIVRELARLGGSLKGFVPEEIEEEIMNKLNIKGEV